MDPLTHTLVGVGLANGLFRRRIGRASVPILAIAANLPDIDTIVHVTGDPASLLLRRTFGHSILMAPVWSLLLALVLKLFLPRIRFPTLLGLSALGWTVHVLFDLINSFGVMILWPLSDWRPELASVFIIDLILAGLLILPLLIALPKAMRPRLVPLTRLALVATAVYLLACGGGRAAATRMLAAETQARAGRPEFTYVFPEPLGPHRWRGVAREGGAYDLYLLHVLSGRVEPRGRIPTATGDPIVERVRDTRRGRRVEQFFKASVWSVERDDAGGAGARVSVSDLRFHSLVLKRDPVFVFRFRVHPDGRIEPLRRLTSSDPSPGRDAAISPTPVEDCAQIVRWGGGHSGASATIGRAGACIRGWSAREPARSEPGARLPAASGDRGRSGR